MIRFWESFFCLILNFGFRWSLTIVNSRRSKLSYNWLNWWSWLLIILLYLSGLIWDNSFNRRHNLSWCLLCQKLIFILSDVWLLYCNRFYLRNHRRRWSWFLNTTWLTHGLRQIQWFLRHYRGCW